MTSTRPYLIRAYFEWIVDNSLTPYILVSAEDETVSVPRQYVNNGKIVLNISPTAVQGLDIDNHALSFSARFGGHPWNIWVPIKFVLAIYASENGKGIMFQEGGDDGDDEPPPDKNDKPSGPKKSSSDKRPVLRVVK